MRYERMERRIQESPDLIRAIGVYGGSAMNSERKEAITATNEKLKALNDVLRMIKEKEAEETENIDIEAVEALRIAINSISLSNKILDDLVGDREWISKI